MYNRLLSRAHEKNDKFRAWMNKLLHYAPNYKQGPYSHADLYLIGSNAEKLEEEIRRQKLRYAVSG